MTRLCLVFLAITSFAIGQNTNLPLAEQVVEAAGLHASMESNFIQSMDTATEQLKATGGEELAKAATDVMRKFFSESLNWEVLRPVYGEAYAAEYNEQELKDLLAFYQSPLGKKLASKASVLTAKTTKAMNEKLKDKLPALQAEIMKVVREHMEKKQTGSK